MAPNEAKGVSLEKALKKIADRVEDLIDCNERPTQYVRDVYRQWKSDGGKFQGKARHSDHFLEDKLKERDTPVRSLVSKLTGRTRIKPGDGAALMQLFLSEWPEQGATEADGIKYKPIMSAPEIGLVSNYIRTQIDEKEWAIPTKAAVADALPGEEIDSLITRYFYECDALITVSPEQTLLAAQPRSELIGFRNLMNEFWAIEQRDKKRRALIWVLDLGGQTFDDEEASAKFLNVWRLRSRFEALKGFDDWNSEERWKWLQSRAVFIVLNTRDDTQQEHQRFKRPIFAAHNVSLSSVAPAWIGSPNFRALYGSQLDDVGQRSFSIFFRASDEWPSETGTRSDLRYFGYSSFLLDKAKGDYQVRGLELPQLHAGYAGAFRTVCAAAAHVLGISNLASEHLNISGQEATLQLRYLGYLTLHLEDFMRGQSGTTAATARLDIASPSKRKLNAWINNSRPKVREAFRVSINIGGDAKDTLAASVDFLEPDWSGAESLELVVSISCLDCTVKPSWQELELPRKGDSQKIDFSVTSRKAGNREFTVRVYLAKQMIQLQSLRFTVTVAEAETQPAETV